MILLTAIARQFEPYSNGYSIVVTDRKRTVVKECRFDGYTLMSNVLKTLFSPLSLTAMYFEHHEISKWHSMIQESFATTITLSKCGHQNVLYIHNYMLRLRLLFLCILVGPLHLMCVKYNLESACSVNGVQDSHIEVNNPSAVTQQSPRIVE
ncbi:hypothetical protein KIN20_008374 [Parelaphostrongylus tenuis]|uniref:Uncharacterized protein n=1 Tax=Parelaphostrongylus tenuis TaxID=148309 RepID=A0AAD5M4S0_PARTN|nr:hypothetical protein KIN20_008374 [Parelaphostrongylus tenuis]